MNAGIVGVRSGVGPPDPPQSSSPDRGQSLCASEPGPVLLAPCIDRPIFLTKTTPMNAPLRGEDLIAATAKAAAEPIILFEDVSKTFAGRGAAARVQALDDVSFAVLRGDVFGVIGRSGAGKSTLIRLINGLERATTGRILVDGHDITRLSERALTGPRRKTGMIFQHFNLLSSRTAFGNIALPLEIAGRAKSESLRRREIPGRRYRCLVRETAVGRRAPGRCAAMLSEPGSARRAVADRECAARAGPVRLIRDVAGAAGSPLRRERWHPARSGPRGRQASTPRRRRG